MNTKPLTTGDRLRNHQESEAARRAAEAENAELRRQLNLLRDR